MLILETMIRISHDSTLQLISEILAGQKRYMWNTISVSSPVVILGTMLRTSHYPALPVISEILACQITLYVEYDICLFAYANFGNYATCFTLSRATSNVLNSC